MLDESQVVLHSSDSIAPVGILHPLAFHLVNKRENASLSDSNRSSDVCLGEMDSVCEVQGNCLQRCKAKCQSGDVTFSLTEVEEHKLHISKTKNDDTFSISCWLQDSCQASAGKSKMS